MDQMLAYFIYSSLPPHYKTVDRHSLGCVCVLSHLYKIMYSGLGLFNGLKELSLTGDKLSKEPFKSWAFSART